ncbi:hypothetical protein SteCoe_30003 [Stentor coeruleus]|uniref:Uncharacterized protein n=1 Tax=Stentor coeruleus TaxID=5963 RepID=A0A1R2B4Q0_9CILI|nr:hypothetical protein SteCoe_30003 [Stentor coeruleus]
MEEKKADFSNTHDDSGLNIKMPLKSILRSPKPENSKKDKKDLRKSKTTIVSNSNIKKVNFPDKVKKPLYEIIEVEPFIYVDQPLEVKKDKSKGCACIAF